MTVPNKALVLDLLEWVAAQPRAYDDVMAAWRTSCPRLPVWEDALDLGFVALRSNGASGAVVVATPAGEVFLRAERPALAGSPRLVSLP
jgi:hypothetical protein